MKLHIASVLFLSVVEIVVSSYRASESPGLTRTDHRLSMTLGLDALFSELNHG